MGLWGLRGADGGWCGAGRSWWVLVDTGVELVVAGGELVGAGGELVGASECWWGWWGPGWGSL